MGGSGGTRVRSSIFANALGPQLFSLCFLPSGSGLHLLVILASCLFVTSVADKRVLMTTVSFEIVGHWVLIYASGGVRNWLPQVSPH